MMKRHTSNIYFDLYLNAAKKQNIKFKYLISEKPIGYFYKDGKKLYITYNKLGVNNCVSYLFATNKYRTYKILDLKKLPHPKAILIKKDETINDIENKIKKLTKPLVVKPLKGSEGHGVTVKINTINEIKNAIKFARKYNNKIIIEEFIEGNHFRILVFQNRIIDIVQRIPAKVKGNGKDTIKSLINIKNKKRKKSGLAKIRIDEELLRHIKGQNLTLSYIPKNEETVSLRLNSNMCAGGETTRININSIPSINRKMFVESTNLLGLTLSGIDFITDDITKPYSRTRCVINEINKAPMGNVHYFADMKMNNIVCEKILSLFFKS